MLVKRTKPISPSKIGLFDDCRLRYIAESEGVVGSRLPAGPAAYIGIAVHSTIESLVGRSNLEMGLIRSVLTESLSALLASPKKSSLVSHAAFQRFGLRGVVPQARILSLCGYVKDVLDRLPQQAGSHKPSPSTTASPASQLGIEKWVASESLGMAGRIDYSYLDEGGSLRVVDFKTGRVTGEDGAPKPGYLMQIAAYGLMLRESMTISNVRLRLESPRGSWEGDLTPELENRVRYAARVINRSLPFEKYFEMEAIATPGEHCASCSVRPSCAKYLSALSKGETGAAFPAIPVGDLFGKVIYIKAIDGLVKVQLERPDIGRVTVTGIPEPIWSGSMGDAVFMFSLRTNEPQMRARYVANFHVLDVAQPQGSAFESLITQASSDLPLLGNG